MQTPRPPRPCNKGCGSTMTTALLSLALGGMVAGASTTQHWEGFKARYGKRYHSKDAEDHAGVAIKALSRQAMSIELRPRTSGFSATGAIPGIWLREGNDPGESRVVLPSGSFMVRENLEFEHDGRRYLLTPVELLEAGRTFEIGRYREQLLD